MSRISRRRFIAHSAHRTIGVSAGLAALRSAEVLAEFGEAGPPERPVRLCLVSGSLEYKSDESLAWLQEYLRKGYDVECSRAFRKTDDDLPGLENLDHCDTMILFTRRLTIGGQQLDRIKRYFERGGPVVAVRTASHAFQNWLALDKEVLGGDYQGHYGNAILPEVHLVEAAKDHPVLKGVEPFKAGGSLYKNPKIAGDTTVLMTGTIPGHTEPVTWTRLHNGGRVLYTSLGHPDDFHQPSYLRLLVNAIFWTAGRETAPSP